MKQVRYPSLRYQTIKQVGHLVIYTNFMSLVVACVAGGICFGDLAKRRLACVEFQFCFGANKDFGFGRSRNGTSTIFRTVFRSLLRNRAKVLVTQTTRRLGSSQKIGRRLQESSHPSPACNAGYQCKKSLVKMPPDTLVIMIAKDFSFSI